jgi:MraZ protein
MDAKGRIAVPSRYRQTLQDLCEGRLVITLDRSGCLLLYPEPEWLEVEQKLRQLPATNNDARRLQRLMVGHATELELDKQGRILLPAVLREVAALERHIMLVGQINKFELWDETAWNQMREQWMAAPMEEEANLSLPEAFDSLTL